MNTGFSSEEEDEEEDEEEVEGRSGRETESAVEAAARESVDADPPPPWVRGEIFSPLGFLKKESPRGEDARSVDGATTQLAGTRCPRRDRAEVAMGGEAEEDEGAMSWGWLRGLVLL